MSTAAAEALFSTARLDIVFLGPDTAAKAGKVLMLAPAFYEAEFEAPPTPEDVTGLLLDMMTGDPPPGVTRAQVFPLGLALKGSPDFIGMAHLVLGFPTENRMLVVFLILAESQQKKGFGREFIQGMYDWARPQGIDFLRVKVRGIHAGAKAFLDKLGFAELTEGNAWERKLPATED